MGRVVASQKELIRSFGKSSIFGCDYCAVQHLFRNRTAEYAIVSKMYGWQCDCYVLRHDKFYGDILLTTGYCSFGQDIKQLAEKYNNKAYGADDKEIKRLQREFTKELMKLRLNI